MVYRSGFLALFTVFSVSLLIPVRSHAATEPVIAEIAKDVVYTPSDFAQSSSYNTAFDTAIEKQGYRTSRLPGEASFQRPLMWINRLYFRKGNGAIYSKGGVHIAGDVAYGKLYRLSRTRFVAHFQDLDYGDHVFFFDGMSPDAATALVKRLSSLTKTLAAQDLKDYGPIARRSSIASLVARGLISRASGVELKNNFCLDGPSTELAKEDGQTLLNNVATRCGWGAIKGVWDSTGGLVQAGVDLVAGSLRFAAAELYYSVHPVQAVEAIADSVKGVVNFFANFNTSMEAVFEGAWNLSANEKAELICELGGSLGTGAIVTAFTGGTGGAAVAKNVVGVVEKALQLGAIKNAALAKKVAALTEKAAANIKRGEDMDKLNAATRESINKVSEQIKTMENIGKTSETEAQSAKAAYEAYAAAALQTEAAAAGRVKDTLAQLNADLNKVRQKVPTTIEERSDMYERLKRSTSLLVELRKGASVDSALDIYVQKTVNRLQEATRLVGRSVNSPERLDAALEAKNKALEDVTQATRILKDAKLKAPQNGWPEFSADKAKDLKAAADVAVAKSEAVKVALTTAKVDAEKVLSEVPESLREAKLIELGIKAPATALAVCHIVDESKLNAPKADPTRAGATQQ